MKIYVDAALHLGRTTGLGELMINLTSSDPCLSGMEWFPNFNFGQFFFQFLFQFLTIHHFNVFLSPTPTVRPPTFLFIGVQLRR